MRGAALLGASLLALLAAACDESFTPLEPSGIQFSIWGFLDASADTQWIRVMDMRPLLATEPGPLGATVLLEHTATGRKLVLRDSVFNFGANTQPGVEGTYVHNYWTAERIEPGATYRFSAQHAGGEEVTATVRVPADYDITVMLKQPWVAGSDLVQLTGLKHVAFVTATVLYYDSCGSATQRKYSPAANPDPAGAYSIALTGSVINRAGCGPSRTEAREVWIAGSEVVWPLVSDFDIKLGAGLPATPTITNSLGFLGGVLTKRVPYETCEYAFRDANTPAYCQLHYDSLKASVHGRVWDRRCSWGVPRAAVRLQEVNPKPPLPPRVRTLQTTRTGEFDIRGIDAGQWLLRISRDEVPDPDVLEYDTYTTTLTFAPGQQLTHDLSMLRNVACGGTP